MTDVNRMLAELRVEDEFSYWTAERIELIEVVPLTGNAWQQVSITLEDIPMVFTLRWNEIAAGWFFDLISSDESITIRGLRMSPGIDLLRGLAFPELGKLYVTDLQNEIAEPNFDELQDRFMLWYLPLEATE